MSGVYRLRNYRLSFVCRLMVVIHGLQARNLRLIHTQIPIKRLLDAATLTFPSVRVRLLRLPVQSFAVNGTLHRRYIMSQDTANSLFQVEPDR